MNLTPQTPPHPSGDKRFKLLDVAIKRHQFRQDALIELLHAAQELFGFLDNDVIAHAKDFFRAHQRDGLRVGYETHHAVTGNCGLPAVQQQGFAELLGTVG